MNNDLISRSALLEAMPKNDEIFSFEVRRVICNAPAVDAEVVRHGRWIEGFFANTFECSVCFDNGVCLCHKKKSKHCPECGAKMDGDVDAAD